MSIDDDRPSAAYQVRHRRKLRLPRSAEARERLRRVPLIWVPSRFNVSVDFTAGRKAVYNTFSSALTVVPTKLWERFLAPGSKLSRAVDAIAQPLNDLYDRGFLVSEGTDEIDLLRLHFQGDRHQRARKVTVNILPTLGCNLQCPYCFEGALQVEKHTRAMSAETEDAVVAYLKQAVEGGKGLTVSWFGGEPLIGMGTIERMSPRLVALCEEANLAYGSVLTTNGVLLTGNVVERLAKASVSTLQVTVDVPTETKRDKKGRDTQDIVLDNLVAASGELDVHLRINLTRDDQGEWDRLYEGLVSRNLDKTLKTVNIANVYQPEPEHARSGEVRSNVAHEAYVDVVRRQRRSAREQGLPMHMSLSWRVPGGCAATSEAAFTIDPDGFVYKCPEDAGWPERAYGSVFVDGALNQQNSLSWLAYDWFQYEECRDCAALPKCAGGCAHRRLFQPDLEKDDYCYWFLRGDIEGRIYDLATSLTSGGDAA